MAVPTTNTGGGGPLPHAQQIEPIPCSHDESVDRIGDHLLALANSKQLATFTYQHYSALVKNHNLSVDEDVLVEALQAIASGLVANTNVVSSDLRGFVEGFPMKNGRLIEIIFKTPGLLAKFGSNDVSEHLLYMSRQLDFFGGEGRFYGLLEESSGYLALLEKSGVLFDVCVTSNEMAALLVNPVIVSGIGTETRKRLIKGLSGAEDLRSVLNGLAQDRIMLPPKAEGAVMEQEWLKIATTDGEIRAILKHLRKEKPETTKKDSPFGIYLSDEALKELVCSSCCRLNNAGHAEAAEKEQVMLEGDALFARLTENDGAFVRQLAETGKDMVCESLLYSTKYVEELPSAVVLLCLKLASSFFSDIWQSNGRAIVEKLSSSQWRELSRRSSDSVRHIILQHHLISEFEELPGAHSLDIWLELRDLEAILEDVCIPSEVPCFSQVENKVNAIKARLAKKTKEATADVAAPTSVRAPERGAVTTHQVGNALLPPRDEQAAADARNEDLLSQVQGRDVPHQSHTVVRRNVGTIPTADPASSTTRQHKRIKRALLGLLLGTGLLVCAAFIGGGVGVFVSIPLAITLASTISSSLSISTMATAIAAIAVGGVGLLSAVVVGAIRATRYSSAQEKQLAAENQEVAGGSGLPVPAPTGPVANRRPAPLSQQEHQHGGDMETAGTPNYAPVRGSVSGGPT